jgi:hypothetical protein
VHGLKAESARWPISSAAPITGVEAMHDAEADRIAVEHGTEHTADGPLLAPTGLTMGKHGSYPRQDRDFIKYAPQQGEVK